MNDFVERHDSLQQGRDYATLVRNLLVEIGVVNVGPPENIFGVTEAELIADGGNISSDCAVAERNDIACALANFVGRREVLLVADSALDEASIDVVRVFLNVDNGTEHEINFLGEFEEGLVEIEE
jgi:hypothetical protein